MLTFFEYLGQGRTVLPDSLTLMKMAGVRLGSPTEKEMKQLIDKEKGRSGGTVLRDAGRTARPPGGTGGPFERPRPGLPVA
jgi:hypothetical protein